MQNLNVSRYATSMIINKSWAEGRFKLLRPNSETIVLVLF